MFGLPNGTDLPPGVTNRPVKGLESPLHDLLATNRASALIRPLLDDLVQEESLVEVRSQKSEGRSGAGMGAILFAIHLSPTRAALWQTNLAVALELVTGGKAAPSSGPLAGWQLQITNLHSCFVNLQRTPEGLLLSLTHTNVPSLALRPSAFSLPTNWLEATIDSHQFSEALSLGWHLPEMVPAVNLTVTGDGSNALTRVQFDFPRPLTLQLAPWDIPTNLIRGPLHSFTAVRGVGSLLGNCAWWANLSAGPPPNQLFFWAQGVYPFANFCAASVPNMDTAVRAIGEKLMSDVNPVLAPSDMGGFDWVPGSSGVAWKGAPMMVPFVSTAVDSHRQFVLAGLARNTTTNLPAPAGTIQELLTRSNAVYFDQELTGPELERWVYISQTLRFVTLHAQLPEDSICLPWFRAIGSRLGPCKTTLTVANASRLELSRSSTLGLTGLEIQLMADWLESPAFPAGLHTFEAPRMRPPKRPH
jgi:hypothetical protein